MNYNSLDQIVLLVDALLSTIVFGVLAFRGRRFWGGYTASQRWLWAAFTIYVGTVAYVSFELFAQNAVEHGIRAYIILVANGIALIALGRHPTSIIMENRDDPDGA